ncbi:FtsK/SpoIIIE domain-containing protein [Blastococcus sp. PRF04-17]|uniref:FtsK/SpoIIIE domain-containing protein n=1 Tax=Blastococcus sp. PRF04-17 TaxID=2933797 RepID=UPI003530048C
MDVEVTAADVDTVEAVLPALSRVTGSTVTALWKGPVRLAGDLRLTSPHLGHGAVLGCDGPAPTAANNHSSPLELQVVGGPAAGHTHPLALGRHEVGRAGDVAVRIDDPDVSRRHAVVEVGNGAITVADQGSTNGSRLDGVDLGRVPAVWPADAVLRIGASSLRVTGPAGSPAALEPAPGGRLRLRPTPRLTAPDGEVEVAIPGPPSAPPRRRLAWVAILLPAVAGGLMAWLLATPTFLFFALLSPVVGVGTWLSERWSGRRAGQREAATHAAELASAEARVAEAVRADRRAIETTHPDPATVATAARRRTHLLWTRSARGSETLSARVGSGPGTTRVVRRQADGSRAQETAASLPVVVDLAAHGGLAVAGPRARALGAVTTVLAQLAVLHAPGDVDLALLTDPARLPDWAWVRWLPHLGPHAVRVQPGAADGPDEALHAWLTDLVALRRAASADPPRAAGPSRGRLLVLVDRALPPELVAVLRSGRDAGVVVLTLADTPEDLPVPLDAVLCLQGETGDQAVLGVQGTPDRPGVTVDRMPLAVAADLARDLAGLVPAGSGGGLPSAVRLLDLPAGGLRLDDTGRLTGAWSHGRDRLVAALGRSAQGPVQLDLVRQGPHALVAGTTGSGKSELLQTLITGLAMNHPPSRCSFLLVDYKGAPRSPKRRTSRTRSVW